MLTVALGIGARLSDRIAPLIEDGGRVVMVASSGHRMADFSLDDPGFEHTPYDPFVAYGRSKTANILFAVELDRRLRTRGVRATALHPGGIETELARHIGGGIDEMLAQINTQRSADGKPPFEYKTVSQGAATSVWAAVVASGDEVGGHYCEDCHVSTVVEGPLGPVDEGVRAYALDPENARALWRKSEEMVSESFSR